MSVELYRCQKVQSSYWRVYTIVGTSIFVRVEINKILWFKYGKGIKVNAPVESRVHNLCCTHKCSWCFVLKNEVRYKRYDNTDELLLDLNEEEKKIILFNLNVITEYTYKDFLASENNV